MGLPPRSENRSEAGIALFVVIAAMTVLSILVTEFTYIAQVNQKMAYDGLDQIKAHYLAKTGFKLSLLRLKAYKNVKAALGAAGEGAAAAVPRQLLEQIWAFPFFYPLSSVASALPPPQRDAILKFEKESGLAGRFSAVIESESSRYNLNSILAPFAAPNPSPSASPSPNPRGDPPDPGTAQPSPQPSFDPESARQALAQFLDQIWQNKAASDPDFVAEFRDFKVEDLIDNLAHWADHKYERRNSSLREYVPRKGAPFYSISELHMVYPLEDRLFDLFAPRLTVTPTPGININTIQADMLRAIAPGLTEEEAAEVIKERDNPEEDKQFKNEDDFFKLLAEKSRAYGDTREIEKLKESYQARRIRLVVDETEFKITVQATVNTTTRLLEAWVTLKGEKKADAPTVGPDGQPLPPQQGSAAASGAPPADTGIKVTFLRIL